MRMDAGGGRCRPPLDALSDHVATSAVQRRRIALARLRKCLHTLGSACGRLASLSKA